jgi:hypothetical protein
MPSTTLDVLVALFRDQYASADSHARNVYNALPSIAVSTVGLSIPVLIGWADRSLVSTITSSLSVFVGLIFTLVAVLVKVIDRGLTETDDTERYEPFRALVVHSLWTGLVSIATLTTCILYLVVSSCSLDHVNGFLCHYPTIVHHAKTTLESLLGGCFAYTTYNVVLIVERLYLAVDALFDG